MIRGTDFFAPVTLEVRSSRGGLLEVEGRSVEELRLLAVAARETWPEVAVDDDDFVAYLRAIPRRLEAATAANAGDLLLALGAARGDPAALRILDREYLGRLEALLPAKYRGEAKEIAQVLRDRLLVPDPDGRVRISEYCGRGGLASWLRVAAVRAALNQQRSQRREVGLEEDGALAERAAGDLEIDYLKRRYRDAFRDAFSTALGRLDARDRNILRLHYLDGLTMESIGALYHVHRVTVVRWMEHARVALARETRAELTGRLQVDRRELESILRLIESQVDLSLRAFLGKE